MMASNTQYGTLQSLGWYCLIAVGIVVVMWQLNLGFRGRLFKLILMHLHDIPQRWLRKACRGFLYNCTMPSPTA